VSEPRFRLGDDFAREMDAGDPLAHFRERFFIPQTDDGKECIYLGGHSLGLQPKSVKSYLEQELKDWARLGVEGHFHAKNPWMPYHRLLTRQTGALVGAEAGEVVVMNSLTVNLHLMMVSFYRPTAERYKILVERGAFPSDQYAIQSQIRFHGFDPASSILELTARDGEFCVRDEDIHAVIEREGDSIALFLIGGVNYATGQVFDMEGITKAGHRKGCVVGFDLAHAVGNVPLHLHDWDPDFAVWCSYKYLNGGPGCVGGCFVHARHARDHSLPRFTGWWGHDEKIRFQMAPDFHAMAGAEGWQLSNPPIMALAPLRASMEIFEEATVDRLRAKSITLTAYLKFLLKEAGNRRFSIITPSEEARRGCQLSLRIPEGGREVCDKLAAEGVIGDWREPDVYRIAAIPLYNSYHDAYFFAQRFLAALA
jgi:kynureninase